MGRWLQALQNHENAESDHPQKPQKSPEPIIGGFGGACSGHIEKISEDPEVLLGVLGVPVSGEYENFSGSVTQDAQPKTDAELYIDALRIIGPCGYGGVGSFLGWGMTRAGQVEEEVRKAGLIRYDRTGRATVVEAGKPPF
ncbi:MULTISPECIES: hypothetical protein [unclassified Shinella]|uniref:hypothetical protein n=1 Tax=unclassified Shinella TaxID=2643062 RepID=UPI00234EAEA3|nr:MULTISPECIES: hypothetical protein [unclassified Shinella]MCO5139284.1 hypothetical protein [Shinella sp.]MDC7255987.1 hypothetical protein [Shinella sp. YE25]